MLKTLPDSQLLPRLSEQTLLVQKLTEQNANKDRSISSLRTDVQKLVRGAGRRRRAVGAPGPAGGRVPGGLGAEAEALQYTKVQARLLPTWSVGWAAGS